jgi:hypothetical protein
VTHPPLHRLLGTTIALADENDRTHIHGGKQMRDNSMTWPENESEFDIGGEG